MSLVGWLQEKWVNRVRQFGFHTSLMQVICVVLRPVWRVNRDLILGVFPDHQQSPHNHPEIRDMTVEMVESAAQKGELTQRDVNRLKGFLDQGCRGFMAEIDHRIAGYIFIQPEGIYPFCRGGTFQIPEGMMVLKNLLVFPEFRGRSLGKKLNQACIATIPKDQTPIVFVMAENRFAIRNFKMFGFEEILTVTRITWLGRWTRQSVNVLYDCEISRKLIRGLEIGSENVK